MRPISKFRQPQGTVGERRRILLAVTADGSLNLMRGFPRYLASQGWDVHVVSSPGPNHDHYASLYTEVTFHSIEMSRSPKPAADAVAFLRWLKLLAQIRPEVLSVGTPKAALLGSVAGWILRVPRRIYVLRGLRHEGLTGLSRSVLKMTERTVARASHGVIAVSASLRDLAVSERLVRPSKITVVGAGSSNGVDTDRFCVTDEQRTAAKRARWPDIPEPQVVGYVGRIHPDKGFDLLAATASELAARGSGARLLVVGGADSGDAADLLAQVNSTGLAVDLTGMVRDVAPLYALMDVLCLPTKREGFPNVVLEAAAAGVPTVATKATGVPDAVLHEETGIICESRSPQELADALARLLEDERERKRFANAARERTNREFRNIAVWDALDAFYAEGGRHVA